MIIRVEESFRGFREYPYINNPCNQFSVGVSGMEIIYYLCTAKRSSNNNTFFAQQKQAVCIRVEGALVLFVRLVQQKNK